MSIDLTKVQFSSLASSNKLALQTSSSFYIPANPGNTITKHTETIPHNLGTDLLMFQIYVLINQTYQSVPWLSNDGRQSVYGYVDATNIYLTGVVSSSSSYSTPEILVGYMVKVLIP